MSPVRSWSLASLKFFALPAILVLIKHIHTDFHYTKKTKDGSEKSYLQ
ncbi:MAG: hypothetical protein ACR5KW_00505 [Wolbachia sp.]